MLCRQVSLSTVETPRLNGTWMLTKLGRPSWTLLLTCPTKAETPWLVLQSIQSKRGSTTASLCLTLKSAWWVHAVSIAGMALNYILQNNFKENVGMRPNARKIGVLITDGKSQDDVIANSLNLREEGIELYAIGNDNSHPDSLYDLRFPCVSSY